MFCDTAELAEADDAYINSCDGGFTSYKILDDLKSLQKGNNNNGYDRARLYDDAVKMLQSARRIFPGGIEEAVSYCGSLKKGERLEGRELGILVETFGTLMDYYLERLGRAEARLDAIGDD